MGIGRRRRAPWRSAISARPWPPRPGPSFSGIPGVSWRILQLRGAAEEDHARRRTRRRPFCRPSTRTMTSTRTIHEETQAGRLRYSPSHALVAEFARDGYRESSCPSIGRCRTHEETRFLRENGFLAVWCLPNKPPRTAASAVTCEFWIPVSPEFGAPVATKALRSGDFSYEARRMAIVLVVVLVLVVGRSAVRVRARFTKKGKRDACSTHLVAEFARDGYREFSCPSIGRW